VGTHSAELATVVRVDWAALALLLVGAVARAVKR
jgi:ABC-type transporter Mla MlaB component